MHLDEHPLPAREPRRRVQTRVLLRIVAVVYLLSLPACVRDAGHFGPGFFPLLAALVLVPLLAITVVTDAFLAWVDALSLPSWRRRWPSLAVATIIALAYLALVAVVAVERGF